MTETPEPIISPKRRFKVNVTIGKVRRGKPMIETPDELRVSFFRDLCRAYRSAETNGVMDHCCSCKRSYPVEIYAGSPDDIVKLQEGLINEAHAKILAWYERQRPSKVAYESIIKALKEDITGLRIQLINSEKEAVKDVAQLVVKNVGLRKQVEELEAKEKLWRSDFPVGWEFTHRKLKKKVKELTTKYSCCKGSTKCANNQLKAYLDKTLEFPKEEAKEILGDLIESLETERDMERLKRKELEARFEEKAEKCEWFIGDETKEILRLEAKVEKLRGAISKAIALADGFPKTELADAYYMLEQALKESEKL